MGNGCSSSPSEHPTSPHLGAHRNDRKGSQLTSVTKGVTEDVCGSSQLSDEQRRQEEQQQQQQRQHHLREHHDDVVLTQPLLLQQADGAAAPIAAAAEQPLPPPPRESVVVAPTATTAGEEKAVFNKQSPPRRGVNGGRRKSLPAPAPASALVFHSVASRAPSPPERRDSGNGIAEVVQQYEQNRWSPLRRHSTDQNNNKLPKMAALHNSGNSAAGEPSPLGSAHVSRRSLPSGPHHHVVPHHHNGGGRSDFAHTIGTGGAPVVLPDGWYSNVTSISSRSAVVGGAAIGSRSRSLQKSGVVTSVSTVEDIGAELHEARKMSGTTEASKSVSVLTFSVCAGAAPQGGIPPIPPSPAREPLGGGVSRDSTVSLTVA